MPTGFVKAAANAGKRRVRKPSTSVGWFFFSTTIVRSEKLHFHRDPTAHDDDRVAEGREHLADVNEHAASGLDLASAVVALVSGFRAHRTGPHAGFKRCSSTASAASSPRPPTFAKSTYVCTAFVLGSRLRPASVR
jgi:hypothetical protein